MTKLFNRFAGALLSAALLFGLVACNSPKPSGSEPAGTPAGEDPSPINTGTTALDPQNPTTVTLWHYYQGDLQDAMEELVMEFNLGQGLETGVVVNPVAMGSVTELEENITNSAKGVINSETLPDMFFSYTDKAMEIDELIDLVDLHSYFTTSELSGYIQSFLDEGYIEERLIVLPIVKSTEILYINATAWDAFCAENDYTDASLATWEGLVAAAEAYYEWTGGDALFGLDSLANFIIVGNRQLGVEMLVPTEAGEGYVQMDEAALRRMFDVYYTSMVQGHFAEAGRFRSDDIADAKIIAYTGSSSGSSYFPTTIIKDNEQIEIEFRALPYPHFEGAGAYTIQQGAGIAVIDSGEAEVEASTLFLKWFTGTAPNVSFSLDTGYLPVTEAAYTSTELSDGLAALYAGDAGQQITASVYEAASAEIQAGSGYSAKAFNGSYTGRRQFQSTLVDMLEIDLETVEKLRAAGMDNAAILEELDPDARFADWLEEIRTGLARQNVAYEG